MEFIWHDGGRAACGFVGSTGDCVARSIAIASGAVYRDVYESLSQMADESARNGVTDPVINRYLASRGWCHVANSPAPDIPLPKGVVLVLFKPISRKRTGHLSCVIDHTVYDTWNPFEDTEYQIDSYWTFTASDSGTSLPTAAPGQRPITDRARLTQYEYERILRRVKALHRTASNQASTEGEVRNAMRAMQSLMLEHNLSRNDIVDDDDVRGMGMTRRACPLNGRRACQWESSLAHYLTGEIFPTVRFYVDRRGNRTIYWFYGPVDDVAQALGLFQEMLLTIAAAARLKYGGHSRGSGASYSEGYVAGLPRRDSNPTSATAPLSQNALVYARTLAVRSVAEEWLDTECGVRLSRGSASSGRYHFDWSAHREGQRDGAQHEPSTAHQQKRLTR